MIKSAGKLIGFVATYTAVAYLVLVLLAVMTGSEVESAPTLLAAFMVALVTVLFDDKGQITARSRAVVLVLLVPVILGWLYHGYQMLTDDFPESGYLWRPLVTVALFVAPTLVGRRLRKGWKRRR